jgi:hypothetical protein
MNINQKEAPAYIPNRSTDIKSPFSQQQQQQQQQHNLL